MKSISPTWVAALAALSLAVTGCSILKPRADLTRFYILRTQPTLAETPPRAIPARLAIRLGPGRIAGYLENAKIAVQDGANRVDYLELERWAEPLSDGIKRALSEHLARMLEGVHLTIYPDPAVEESGYEVHYMVDRFEGRLAGPATLEVAWQIVEYPSGKRIAGARSVYVIPASGSSQDAANYVEQLSNAVAQWANDIVAAVPTRPAK